MPLGGQKTVFRFFLSGGVEEPVDYIPWRPVSYCFKLWGWLASPTSIIHCVWDKMNTCGSHTEIKSCGRFLTNRLPTQFVFLQSVHPALVKQKLLLFHF